MLLGSCDNRCILGTLLVRNERIVKFITIVCCGRRHVGHNIHMCHLVILSRYPFQSSFPNSLGSSYFLPSCMDDDVEHHIPHLPCWQTPKLESGQHLSSLRLASAVYRASRYRLGSRCLCSAMFRSCSFMAHGF